MMEEAQGIPELLLEQYALGELGAADAARIEGALAAEPSLRARLEAIRDSDAEILAAAPPSEVAAAIRRRMLSATGEARRASSPATFLARGGWGFALAAAAAFAFGIFLFRGPVRGADGEMTRMKGGEGSLLVYRQASEGPELLADGQTAEAGDLLQLAYSAGGARFGAILSLDGRGSLTWHLPPLGSVDLPPGEMSPSLKAGGERLPSAYELDDAPAFERFFLIESGKRFDLAEVEKAIRKLSASSAPMTGDPGLPTGLEARSLLLRKDGGR